MTEIGVFNPTLNGENRPTLTEMRKLFRYFEINHNKLREYEGDIKSIYDDYIKILKLVSNSSNANNEELLRLDALQILTKNIVEKLQIVYYKLTD